MRHLKGRVHPRPYNKSQGGPKVSTLCFWVLEVTSIPTVTLSWVSPLHCQCAGGVRGPGDVVEGEVCHI